MTGRPRTSTIVIIGLFLGVLVLYVLVRPAPAGSLQPVDNQGPAPSAPAVTPSSTPKSLAPTPSWSPRPSRTASPARSASASPTETQPALSQTPTPASTPTPTQTPAATSPAPSSTAPAPASASG
jgi:hypothetical protein